MTWWAYVKHVAPTATNKVIGEAAGLTASSVTRWASGAAPDPSSAAAFARAFGRPVLEAFIAAGYLTPEEAGERPAKPHALAHYSDDELVDDIRRRLGERGGTDALSAKAREKRTPPGLRLAARRGQMIDDQGDGLSDP